jgi:UDP-N-acetylglucosamine acyltransferase
MNNFIHPTAIVEPTVKLGSNNYIGPYCVIVGNTTIGNNNRFETFCCIGTPAEHRQYLTHYGTIVIGNDNVVREHVTANGGTVRTTTIGDRNILLTRSYISHDSILEDDITVSIGAAVGGHSHLMIGCNLGINVSLHQFSIIGSYAMIGMGGVVTKKSVITPVQIYAGNPVTHLRTNQLAIERNNLSDSYIENETLRFANLRKRD